MELTERQMHSLAAFMLLICLCLGLGCASSNSEMAGQEHAKRQNTINVVGTGATKDEAIQDALRTAVERAVGVYIFSKTEVENFQVVKDKIISSSRGYVNNYTIVKEDQKEGMIFLTLDVDVNVSSIKATVRKDIKSVTIDEALKDYSLVKQRMDRLKKAEEIVNAIVMRPIDEAYTVDFVGYEIKSVRRDRAVIDFYVKLALNPFYWNAYRDTLKHLEESCRNPDVTSVAYKYHKYGNFMDGCLHIDTATLLLGYYDVYILGQFGKNESFDFLSDPGHKLHFNLLSSRGISKDCFSYIENISKDKLHRRGISTECADRKKDYLGLGLSGFDISIESFNENILIDENEGAILKKSIVVTNIELIKNIKDLKFSIKSARRMQL